VVSFLQVSWSTPCIHLTSPPLCVTFPQIHLLCSITWIILNKKYKSWSSSIQFSPVSFPYIFLTVLFPHIFNLYFSLHVRAQASCPYKRPGKIVVLHILVFIFLDSQWEGWGKLLFYVWDSRPNLTWIWSSVTHCIGLINFRPTWEFWTGTWKWLCLIMVSWSCSLSLSINKSILKSVKMSTVSFFKCQFWYFFCSHSFSSLFNHVHIFAYQNLDLEFHGMKQGKWLLVYFMVFFFVPALCKGER